MFLKGQFIQKCMNNEIKMSLFTYPYVITNQYGVFFPGIQKKNLLSIILTQNELELFFWTESAQQTSWFGSETGLNISVCTEQNSAGAELGSFTSFSVCMFKLRFVFVRSGAGGREGELGLVLLSVRRGSLRAHEHGARVLN